MRRLAAIFLLVVIATFLAVQGADHCHEGEGRAHGGQHLLCVDDCTPAMLPAAPQAPPADGLPKAAYVQTVARPVLNLELEPEAEPPRA